MLLSIALIHKLNSLEQNINLDDTLALVLVEWMAVKPALEWPCLGPYKITSLILPIEYK